MTKTNCNTQRMSVVTSSLMGIIFGSAIIYMITRIVSLNRRVMFMEKHIVNKADDDVVEALSSRVDSVQNMMTGGLAAKVIEDVLEGLIVNVSNPKEGEVIKPKVTLTEIMAPEIMAPVCGVVDDGSPEPVPPPVIDVKVVEEMPAPDQNVIVKTSPIIDVDDDGLHLNIKVEKEDV